MKKYILLVTSGALIILFSFSLYKGSADKYSKGTYQI